MHSAKDIMYILVNWLVSWKNTVHGFTHSTLDGKSGEPKSTKFCFNFILYEKIKFHAFSSSRVFKVRQKR